MSRTPDPAEVYDNARARRRRQLEPTANPSPGLDYLVVLRGEVRITPAESTVRVTVRFVPDRDIVAPALFTAYLNAVGDDAWASLEDAAVAILDDINNELVPRWIQVHVVADASDRNSDGDGDGDNNGWPGHEVLLEDTQPRWQNPTLLSRLNRI